MTAHERLRQLHANASVAPWRYIGSQQAVFRYGPIPVGEVLTKPDGDAIAALRNALPQFANLAEAADTIRESHNDLLVIGRDDDNHYCVLCGQRNGGHWDNCPYRTITRALTDLEQALNPTRNTQ